jgi:hypothetical protein
MIKLDTLQLPDDLTWTDRYRWSPVVQASTITLAGSLIVQEAAQLSGRPITLAGTASSGWISKVALDSLQALAEVPEAIYTLEMHDGSTRQVMFTGARLTADPVVDYSSPADSDAYTLTLFLMETPP